MAARNPPCRVRTELDELLASLDEEERQSDGFVCTPSGGRGADPSEELPPPGMSESGLQYRAEQELYVDSRRRCVRVLADTKT